MIHVRRARPEESERVAAFYRAEGYAAAVRPWDAPIIAEADGELCGVFRLCIENDVLVLRGMRIREDVRRQGIGTRMLRASVPIIGERDCFCIPYRHLCDFYGQIGFLEIDHAEAPPFLHERCAAYVRRGLDAIIMHRPVRR